MRVYLVRHGESMANRDRIHAGWSQTPLSEKGEQMARKLGQRLKGLSFDAVFSSDLLRALQTAELALPGCKPVQDMRLREINVGCLSGFSPTDMGRKYGESYWRNREARDFTAYGGETTDNQKKRVLSFFQELAAGSEENVIVFCHEGTIKCMLSIVLDTSVHEKITGFRNCSISVFEIGNNKKWKLITWNDYEIPE